MEPDSTAKPDQTDLAALRATTGFRALAWLGGEFPRFNLGPGQAYSGLPPDEITQTVFAEMALLIFILGRRTRLTKERNYLNCLDHLERMYAQPRFHGFVRLADHPLALTAHVLICLALSSQKRRVPLEPPELEQAAGIIRQNIGQVEGDRLLEVRYILDQAGLPHGLPDYQALLEPEKLGMASAPAGMAGEPQIYEATHLVFYLTDYGRRVPAFITDSAQEQIKAHLCALLETMLAARHWDLTAELLLCLSCLGGESLPQFEAGWQALARAQDPSGAISQGPGGKPAALPAPGRAARGQFLRLYHRSLVTALAAFAGQPH